MAEYVRHTLPIFKVWHHTGQADRIVHGVSLLREIKADGAHLLALLEDPLLGANLLQPLDVLEDGVEDFVLIGETFLG